MKNLDIKLENVFALIMLTIGVLLVFIIPPMASPDENTHFYNAYAFSKFDFFPEFEIQNRNGIDQLSELGRRQPKVIVDYAEYYNAAFYKKLDKKYDFEAMYTDSFVAIDMEELVFHAYWNSDVNILGYFFSGLGMLIWNMISKIFFLAVNTPYNLLIAGRISNLLFFTFVIYYAIKITPFLKKSMFLIAVMPMSVFLAASISYDAVLIPVCFLLFAYTSSLIVEKRKIKWFDVLVISGITIFLFSIKQVYIGLLLILFAVPISSFRDKKEYIKIIGIVLLAGIIAFFGYRIVLNIRTKDFVGTWSSIQHQQMKIVIYHPIMFLKTIFNSIIRYGDYYFVSFFGNLGQLDTRLPVFILVLYFIIFLITTFFDVSIVTEKTIRRKMKFLSIIGIIFAVYASFAGTYIIWTGMMQGVGADFVDGVQGRYFIPISIYFVLLFANNKMVAYRYYSYIENTLRLLIVWSGCMVNIIMFFILLLRFWI